MEARLRVLEGDFREIKARIEHVATGGDVEIAIAKLKMWAMGGCITGTMAVVGWLVFALVRALQ